MVGCPRERGKGCVGLGFGVGNVENSAEEMAKGESKTIYYAKHTKAAVREREKKEEEQAKNGK